MKRSANRAYGSLYNVAPAQKPSWRRNGNQTSAQAQWLRTMGALEESIQAFIGKKPYPFLTLDDLEYAERKLGIDGLRKGEPYKNKRGRILRVCLELSRTTRFRVTDEAAARRLNRFSEELSNRYLSRVEDRERMRGREGRQNTKASKRSRDQRYVNPDAHPLVLGHSKVDHVIRQITSVAAARLGLMPGIEFNLIEAEARLHLASILPDGAPYRSLTGRYLRVGEALRRKYPKAFGGFPLVDRHLDRIAHELEPIKIVRPRRVWPIREH